MESFQYLRNQFLFSEAYLFSLLETEWTDESLDGIRQSLKDWLDVADFTALDTALASFIEPVLQTLQFACQPPPQSEPKAQSGNSQSSMRLLYTDFTFQNPVGVCFAVAPSQDLSCTLKGANFAEKLIRLLRENDLKWGILTNGKLWRLYHKNEPMPYETYFEVDLTALLQEPESKEFSLFARFFGVRAFYSSDEREGRDNPLTPFVKGECLDEMKRASEEATEEIGKHLREKIETILENISAGFVEDEGKERFTEAEREEIHHNAIYLLYRIMFLLYAEARNLLPMENPKYREKSLERLIEISYKNQTEGIENPDGYELWKSLRQLCTEIDLGNAELEVAPYDGGLFDAGTHPYLSEHQMTNAYLSPVLYALAYYEKKNSPLNFRGRSTRINYRDMSVRHLGTLYEGILEYKLFVAEEPMVVRPTKSGFQFLPEREAGTLKKTDRRIPIGGVYFAQNPGERKATGSYYTPEYIVEYIIQNTVGEKLKELKATLKQSLSKDLDALKVAISDDERIRFQRFIDRQIYDFVNERVLSFRVLDPAMGSGHFLVNATNAIANFITELLNETGWENPELDTSTGEWRRRVVESCIFGVDLNPLAVELSKLSLWITAAAKDRPLSFLDHHLKWGNSLIGAKLNELGRYPQAKKGKGESQTPEVQMSLFTENRDFQRDIAEAIRGYLDIEQIVTRQREDVETKKEKLETIEKILRPYRELCELHTGVYFENEFSEDDYSRLITEFQPDAWDSLKEKYDVAKVLARTSGRIFFHWELEFPEVFFEEGGRKENPGFDAVVANPPYDVLVGVKYRPDLRQELFYYSNSNIYKYAFGGRLNIYRLFIERSLQSLGTEGLLGFIVPEGFYGDRGAGNLRQFVFRTARLFTSEVFPGDAVEHRVFPEAEQPVCIVIAQKGQNTKLLELRIHQSRHIELDSPIIALTVEHIKEIDKENLTIPMVDEPQLRLAVKLHTHPATVPIGGDKGIALGFEGEVNVTGHNEFISDHDTGALLVRGEHVHRYEVLLDITQKAERWLDRERFLRKMQWAPKSLHHQRERVAVQGIKGKNRKRRITACLVPPGVFLGNSADYYLVKPPYSPLYLLAHLNSQVPEWRFRLTSTNNNINAYEIEAIPIRRIAFTTMQEERARLGEIGITEATEFIETTEVTSVSFSAFSASVFGRWLNVRLPTNPDGSPDTEHEQSDVVHDLLAYLAEQMIEMNKQKQVAVKDFLTWLEGEIGCPIDDLSGKTIIQGFYEQSVDKLLETLGKNARKLSVDAKSSVFQEEFLQRYESQMATLRPLMERIQRADELIDQIVYKLYGLTEEEINIVEGGMGNGR